MLRLFIEKDFESKRNEKKDKKKNTTEEYNSTLPFLDILLIRNINKLEFKVYLKPTCKNNHIHFYSHYNNNTKRGIIKGFYLRALHICFSKYLNDQFIHIENSFNLQYPKSFILNLKPSKSTIKINLKLMPTHNLIKLVPPIDSYLCQTILPLTDK